MSVKQKLESNYHHTHACVLVHPCARGEREREKYDVKKKLCQIFAK